METNYIGGLLGRPDLASGYATFQPVMSEGSGAVITGSVDASGVGTGQASLTLAGVLVLVLLFAYWGTKGRQH